MEGILGTILVIGIAIGLFFWLGYEVIDDNCLKSKEVILPTMEFAINNNKVDTVYVYCQ